MHVRAISLAIAGLLAMVFLSQGLSAPFEKDEESRPASIIADIMHRGDWLLPADSYGEVTRKPPLYYWLSAAMAEVRGASQDEAGARVVSLVAAGILAAVVMGYAAAWLGGSAGWLAWLFLLGSYGFCSHAGYARTDMLLTLLLFSAYCLLFPVLEGRESARSWLPAGLLLGLAVLTKGPLAIALCALGILIYLLLAGRNPIKLLGRPWPWLTVAVAIAVAAAWYLPAFMKTRGAIASVQLMQENFGHLVPAGMGGTGEAERPFYYLLVRFIGTCFPLSLYIPALLLMLWPLRKVEPALLYQAALLIAVMGLFSIASAKRDDYILPAFPPFAIVLAGAIAARETERSRAAVRLRDGAATLAAAAMLAGAAVGLFLSTQPALVDRVSAHLQSSDVSYFGLFINGLWKGRQALLLIAIAAASVIALVAGRRHNPRAAAAAVALASMAGVSLWVGVLRPGLAARRTFRTFAREMRQATGGQRVFTLDGPEYEIAYYYGAPIEPLAGLAPGDRTPQPRFLLIFSDQIENFAPAKAAQKVLVSRPSPEGRSLVLLKVDTNRFEPLPKNP